MAIVDDRTVNRDYQLPHPTNDLQDDVPRLRLALGDIDNDVAGLLASLAAKAAVNHGHVIGDITGLQAALDTKLTSSSLSSYVTSTALTTTLSGYATTGALSTGLSGKANVSHGHTASDISGLGAVAYSNQYGDLAGKPTIGSSASKDSASVADIRQNTANKVIETDEAWSSLATVTLTDAATIDANFNGFINAKVTLAGNRVISFSNPIDGKSGRIQFIQDLTGNRTISFTAGQCVFAGGTAPVLSTAAGARDVLYYDCLDDGKVFVSLNRALS